VDFIKGWKEGYHWGRSVVLLEDSNWTVGLVVQRFWFFFGEFCQSSPKLVVGSAYLGITRRFINK